MTMQPRPAWFGLLCVAVAAVAVAASAGPAAGAAAPATTLTTTLTTTPTKAVTTAVTTAPTGGAQVVFNRMTEAQRIGQLFMVGGAATGVSSATLSAISSYHVGNVILTGRSAAGVSATRSITNAVQAHASSAATLGVPLFLATDQEGGYVQVLSGSGFSNIPQALTQGTWPTATLQADARSWGSQLAAAGVNLDLAPVADTVPEGEVNPPIGYFNREYGHTTAVVGPHAAAFAEGIAQAGVAACAKHFPGLGRVAENTDTSSGVTDYVTTYDDAYLTPFKAAIQAGSPFAMMSTAYYQQIDPSRPAAFSPTVIGGMLRDELGFKGVVISDDLGSAQQVAAWSPGARAVDFLDAGGDLVLTVTPSVIPAMVDAVSAEAATSSSFRSKVDAAALLVLKAKQAQHLIPGADVPGDFTGDGRTDVGVFRPSTGVWYVVGHGETHYGQAGDVPVPGDYTGDGRTGIAVFRPSTGVWYVMGYGSVHYGESGDVPVPGDYTGAGRAGIAVFRPSIGTWYAIGYGSVHYGQAGDEPVPGDYTGAGRAGIAVFRPSIGTWYAIGYGSMHYGQAGDLPV
ncbi:MAG: glycoside hydrolase family 3 N-terminal domain-containing protein [Jatrophihabitantaceae bacterium]